MSAGASTLPRRPKDYESRRDSIWPTATSNRFPLLSRARGCAGAPCPLSAIGRNLRGEVVGLSYYIHLFDLRAYREKALPAYQAFFEKDDSAPLILLLREIIRGLDVIATLPGPTLSDREIYEDDIGILDGSVYYAPGANHETGRSGRKTTRENKRMYVRDQLTHIILMALCVPRDRGVNPEQNMTRSPLIPYLYKHSEWIEDRFTCVVELRGGMLEIPEGEDALELFSEEDLHEFCAELAKVPAPDGDIEIKKQLEEGQNYLRESLRQKVPEGSPEFKEFYDFLSKFYQQLSPTGEDLRKEYDNLCAIVNLAVEDADLTLTR